MIGVALSDLVGPAVPRSLAVACGDRGARARGGASTARARGQGLVEYGLILSGIAVVAVVTLVFFGDQVAQVLDFIGNLIDQATNT